MKRKFHRVFFGFGCVAMALIPMVGSACATPTVTKSEPWTLINSRKSESLIPINIGHFWENQLKTPTAQPLMRTWDANTTFSLDDFVTQINGFMHLAFTRSITTMSPYDLGKYLVELANSNNLGNIVFQMNYHGEQSTPVIRDFSKLLHDFISALDDPENPVTISTPRSNSTNLTALAAELVAKMGIGGNIIGFFGTYSQDVFDLSALQILGNIALNNDTSPNQRLTKILQLLVAMPTAAISQFPHLIEMFQEISGIFINTPLAKQWALDNKIAEFSNLDHFVVRWAMHQGS